MKSALFSCLVVLNCCWKENVILLRHFHLVVTFCSHEEIICSHMKLLPLLLLLKLSWNLDAAPPRLVLRHHTFVFPLDFLDEGLRRNAANIENPLPYHVVNNEETCLHLLCFRFTELKTSMICPPAQRPQFDLWLKLKILLQSQCSEKKRRKFWFLTVSMKWFQVEPSANSDHCCCCNVWL